MPASMKMMQAAEQRLLASMHGYLRERRTRSDLTRAAALPPCCMPRIQVERMERRRLQDDRTRSCDLVFQR